MAILKTEPKKTILQIDNVQIREHDAYNLAVEVYETYYNPVTKEEMQDWRFKGYTSSIVGGLKMVMKKDLLIYQDGYTDAKSLLKQVQQTEQKILDKLEEL